MIYQEIPYDFFIAVSVCVKPAFVIDYFPFFVHISRMEKRPIIIVGAGPAGIATALSLRNVAPDLASELLVLEKAKHPRPKLCD